MVRDKFACRPGIQETNSYGEQLVCTADDR